MIRAFSLVLCFFVAIDPVDGCVVIPGFEPPPRTRNPNIEQSLYATVSGRAPHQISLRSIRRYLTNFDLLSDVTVSSPSGSLYVDDKADADLRFEEVVPGQFQVIGLEQANDVFAQSTNLRYDPKVGGEDVDFSFSYLVNGELEHGSWALRSASYVYDSIGCGIVNVVGNTPWMSGLLFSTKTLENSPAIIASGIGQAVRSIELTSASGLLVPLGSQSEFTVAAGATGNRIRLEADRQIIDGELVLPVSFDPAKPFDVEVAYQFANQAPELKAHITASLLVPDSRTSFSAYVDDEQNIVLVNHYGRPIEAVGVELRSDAGLEYLRAEPFDFGLSPTENYVPLVNLPPGAPLEPATTLGVRYLGDEYESDLTVDATLLGGLSVVSPSADGLGEGPFSAADMNRDGEVNAADPDFLAATIRAENGTRRFDLNFDEAIDQEDHAYWVTRLFGTTIGDANLDGVTDANDFLVLAENFGTTGGWASGNFNLDDEVDFLDFVLLANNFTPEAEQLAAVPEPSVSTHIFLTIFFTLLTSHDRQQRATGRPSHGCSLSE